MSTKHGCIKLKFIFKWIFQKRSSKLIFSYPSIALFKYVHIKYNVDRITIALYNAPWISHPTYKKTTRKQNRHTSFPNTRHVILHPDGASAFDRFSEKGTNRQILSSRTVSAISRARSICPFLSLPLSGAFSRSRGCRVRENGRKNDEILSRNVNGPTRSRSHSRTWVNIDAHDPIASGIN